MKWTKEKPKKSGWYWVFIEDNTIDGVPDFTDDSYEPYAGSYDTGKDDPEFIEEDSLWLAGSDTTYPIEKVRGWSDEPLPDPPSDAWEFSRANNV